MNERDIFNAQVEQIAEWIVKSRSTVVFTGAGVSTESGIPDFRSPGGIWSKFDPDDFTIDKFLGSQANRDRQWLFLAQSGLFSQAEPNDAHKAVVWLESIGKVSCVITQNVDDLHQKAGSDPDRIYELHGNMKWMTCLDCGAHYSLDDLFVRYAGQRHAPVCEVCGGILKADVIFFGEALPAKTLQAASEYASSCDLFIVIGSSLVVYPAAYLPMYAKNGGAHLVIINRADTPYDAEADTVIHAGAGEVMQRVVAEVKRRLP